MKRQIFKGRPRNFVERRKDGTIKKFVRKGRSLAVDRRVKSKTLVKKGFGNRGDLKRRN
jgi:hypothetical protein